MRYLDTWETFTIPRKNKRLKEVEKVIYGICINESYKLFMKKYKETKDEIFLEYARERILYNLENMYIEERNKKTDEKIIYMLK